MPAELTIDQEHLLKRELLRLQLSKESEALDNMINIDQLGAPFILPDGTYSSGKDYPLCSYILQNFVVGFPLIKIANKKFWQEIAQPFVQGLASKDISSSADRDEATKRRRLGRVVKRLLLLFFVAGIGTNREKDKSTKYQDSIANSDAASTHNSLNADTTAVEDSNDNVKLEKTEKHETNTTDENTKAVGSVTAETIPTMAPALVMPGPYAAVLGVRERSTSGFIRSKTRSEYIIECFFNRESAPVYIARSWSEFVELSKQVNLNFPGKKMPNLPHKSLQNTNMIFNGAEKELMREPQRVTLREYIHKLCQIPQVAKSDLFLDFLFRDRIELSDEERQDIEARLALDKKRFEDKQKFRILVSEREAKLSEYIGEIKQQILLEDALPKIFLEIKMYKRVEDMSPLVQKFVEWCLVQVAYFLFDFFIAQDSSPEMFSQLKRLHSLMPYTAIRGILKLSNPALIMKKLTELFMATPFGSKSIIQQMFIRVLNDDMQVQDKLIADLEERIPEKDVIKALEQYIAEDHYSRIALQQRATEDNVDLVMEIVRTFCSRERTKEVLQWHNNWQEVVKDSQRSEDEDPRVVAFSRLKDLLKLKIRARDKDVLRDFWGDQQTIRFIREVVNLTYDVFIEVFRYANVSESFGDFQKFMDDFVSYVTYATTEVVLDGSQIVDNLLSMLKKHQNSIFKFVNRVYARDSGFFIDLIEWLTLFVSFIQMRKEGKNKVDLLSLFSTSKSIDQEKVIGELDSLQNWLQKRKETAKRTISMPTKTDDFPTANFDVSDVGLSWEDVDYGLAEVERDDMEEFLPDHRVDLSRDQVTLERMRREKLAELEARKAQLAQRPEMEETAKLIPDFGLLLFDTLRQSTLKRFDLNKLTQGISDDRDTTKSS